ncbi:hypothetical protein E3N88_16075 [Mikania micrantha]|uniref:Uncharacterized protein n=1 Tax=Mikania micrantha TaxID=192012 RepID=A0A5N6P0G7_9ASTR|nr:hypothetical protein E3N88_16075 [Mikania micrantha]
MIVLEKWDRSKNPSRYAKNATYLSLPDFFAVREDFCGLFSRVIPLVPVTRDLATVRHQSLRRRNECLNSQLRLRRKCNIDVPAAIGQDLSTAVRRTGMTVTADFGIAGRLEAYTENYPGMNWCKVRKVVRVMHVGVTGWETFRAYELGKWLIAPDQRH